jgi:hypothetical protein
MERVPAKGTSSAVHSLDGRELDTDCHGMTAPVPDHDRSRALIVPSPLPGHRGLMELGVQLQLVQPHQREPVAVFRHH